MNFRTEIGRCRGNFTIDHDDKIVMLGSCFTDSIGEQLELDGFNVIHNPMGPLYNPCSLARVFARGNRAYDVKDFEQWTDGYHCLDFASRYSGEDSAALTEMVNHDFSVLSEAIKESTVIIVTFGTSRVYEFNATGIPVGNCHRLPAAMYDVRLLSIEEIVGLWRDLLPKDKKVIFTLSPIRYIADGLVENSLSKATLRVSIDKICENGGYDYFPSFEILNDDLRDYRFYTSDMKHPSEMAIEYVYERFAEAYFSQSTIEKSRLNRKIQARQRHIPTHNH